MAFAEEVDNYADYALSAAALTSTDNKVVMELREILAEQAPDSKYLIGLNSKVHGRPGRHRKSEEAVSVRREGDREGPGQRGAAVRSGYHLLRTSIVGERRHVRDPPGAGFQRPSGDRTRLLLCRLR